MLENNKCILVYGLTNIDLEFIKKLNYKIIEITPEMCEMTLGDILLGLKLNIYNNNPFKGKVILYNNLTQMEVKNAINDTKRGKDYESNRNKKVTEEFINRKVNYLIKHLKNENEWYSKARKEIKNE